MKGYRGFLIVDHAYSTDANKVHCHQIDHRSDCTEFVPGCDPHVKIEANIIGKATKAVCSDKDKYDFEIGAMIAFMRMIGREKTEKAWKEVYGDTPIQTLSVMLTGGRVAGKSILMKGFEEWATSAVLGEKNKEIERLKKALKSRQATLQKASDKNKELEKNIEGLEIKLTAAEGGLQDAHDMIETKESIITDLFSKLRAQDIEIEKLKNANKELSDDSNAIRGKKRTPLRRDLLWFSINKGYTKVVEVEFNNIQEFLCEAEERGYLWFGGQKPTEWEWWRRWREWPILLFYFENGRMQWDGIKPGRCLDQVREEHSYAAYTPNPRASLFKRNKYCIKVDDRCWESFRRWCIDEVGIGHWLIPPHCPCKEALFTYARDKADIELNLAPPTDIPTYDWEAMM